MEEKQPGKNEGRQLFLAVFIVKRSQEMEQ